MLRFILINFLLHGSLMAKHDTRLCQVCTGVKDPSTCPLATCSGEMSCFVKVDLINGEYLWSKGCMHGCHDHDTSIIVGKRGSHEPHGSHDLSVCRHCCNTAQCNGCGHFLGANPITLQTFVTTTPQPVQTVLPTCRDHEMDGFVCSDYDVFNFCTNTTSGLYKLAVDRCPQHCGLCDSNGNYIGVTVLPPCRDHEEDGFTCSDYDAYNFCTDTFSGLYKLAVDRCPQHCGLCDANGNYKVTAATTDAPAPTAPPTTTTPMSAIIVSGSQTTVTSSQLDASCVDSEDQDFSCAQWASYGFCSNGTGAGYSIAVQRCSKYCGFC